MKLANFNNNLSVYVDFVMENYTVNTDFIANFAILVSQNCYQDSHSKCNKYYCSDFYSKVFRLLSFYSKNSQDVTI